MKIAILTHPLGTNYGGILQNFALQQILKGMGHEPITLYYYFRIPLRIKIFSIINRLLQRLRGKNIPLRVWTSTKEYNKITRNTRSFIKNHITVTRFFAFDDVQSLTGQKVNAICVGSDQVWRGKSSEVARFFLSDFQGIDIKKIAYGASFGVDFWEFKPEETVKCAKLARQFNSVSVREKSGIELCQQYLNVDAQWVLDPTLLLSKEVYDGLIPKEHDSHEDKYLLSYILDQDTLKQTIIEAAVAETYLPERKAMAEKNFKDVGHSGLSQCVLGPVEGWLNGFKNAKYVITDSFHGTIFSIIYHKPFVSIVNKGRGADRFVSLLTMLHLEEHLVETKDEAMKVIHLTIDYRAVDAALEEMRRKSLNFITNSFG